MFGMTSRIPPNMRALFLSDVAIRVVDVTTLVAYQSVGLFSLSPPLGCQTQFKVPVFQNLEAAVAS